MGEHFSLKLFTAKGTNRAQREAAGGDSGMGRDSCEE